MLIKSSIAFDMGMKLSTPDLTADLPLDCFKLFVKERTKKERKRNRFYYPFYVYENESVCVCAYFFLKTEFSRRYKRMKLKDRNKTIRRDIKSLVPFSFVHFYVCRSGA
ncbi:hypothetical protein K0M31_013683 [Melipona bicolor]|uniref:Uncharacterized protein n=1 Tax=Melipona bicolor TaxID=60889 RepID=A0AA40FHX5_9HYME|nr:hypothetical protein K0M31_013683 [Melipona bicolor]